MLSDRGVIKPSALESFKKKVNPTPGKEGERRKGDPNSKLLKEWVFEARSPLRLLLTTSSPEDR